MRRRNLRRLAWVSSLVVIAAVPSAPWVLSQRPSAPLLSLLLRRLVGVELSVERAELSWRGPQTLEGVVVSAPAGFSGAPLLEVKRLRLDGPLSRFFTGPLGLVLEDARLGVEREPAGGNSLRAAAAEGRGRLPRFLARVRSLAAEPLAVRVQDHRKRSLAWLRGGRLLWRPGADAGDRFALSGRLESAIGSGALDVAWTRAPDSTQQWRLSARRLALAAFAPLLRGFSPAATAEGLVDGDLVLRLPPDGGFEIEGPFEAHDLVLTLPSLGVDWTPREARMHLRGRLAFSPRRRLVVAEGFEVVSSLVDGRASGSLHLDDDGLAGDLEARLGVDCDRLLRRLLPQVLDAIGVETLSGNVDVALAALRDGGVTVRADVEHARFQPSLRRMFSFGDSYFHARELNVRPGRRELSIEGLAAGTRFGDVEGRLDLRLEGRRRPPLGSADLSVHLVGGEAQDFLEGALPALQLFSKGELDVGMRFRSTGEEAVVDLEPRSNWFSFRYVEPAGRAWDATFESLSASAHVSLPAGVARPLREAAGHARIASPQLTVYRHELEDFSVRLALEGGRLSVLDLAARACGGELRGEGGALLDEEAPEEWLRLEGKGIHVRERFPAWLSAAALPLLARSPAPFAVDHDLVLSGRLEAHAPALGFSAFLERMRGGGRLRWSGTRMRGSPLLAALSRSSLDDEVPFDRAESEVTLAPGVLFSRARVELGDGRSFALEGSCDVRGRLDYPLPPPLFFDSAFLERYGSRLPPRPFFVRGLLFRPDLRVPDPERWRRLAAEGRLEEAIAALREP